MSFKQQRTKSRRRFDPGQPPLPRQIQVISGLQTGPGKITLTFGEPVILTGIPQLDHAGGGFPTAAEQTGPQAVEFTFDFIQLGLSLQLAANTAGLRGLDGAWVEQWDSFLGCSNQLAPPPLNWLVSAKIIPPVLPEVVPKIVRCQFEDVVAGWVGGKILKDGQEPLSSVIFAPTTVDFTYGTEVIVGSEMSCESWRPGNLMPSGEWVPPFRYRVTETV